MCWMATLRQHSKQLLGWSVFIHIDIEDLNGFVLFYSRLHNLYQTHVHILVYAYRSVAVPLRVLQLYSAQRWANVPLLWSSSRAFPFRLDLSQCRALTQAYSSSNINVAQRTIRQTHSSSTCSCLHLCRTYRDTIVQSTITSPCLANLFILELDESITGSP